jgi:sensor c-di-GMP phosphodiesterase-like protein
MRRWKVRFDWTDLAAVFVAVVPVLALIGVGYFQAVHQVSSDLSRIALASANRSTEIFVQARKNLQVLALNTQAHCNDTAVKSMRDVVFRSVYFREAGTIINNSLACTDVGIMSPPIPILHESNRVLADFGEIAIIPPSETIRPGKSIIVNYKVTDHAYVNLLINPDVFSELEQYPILGERNAIFVLNEKGDQIAGMGNVELTEIPVDDLLRSGQAGISNVRRGGVFYALQKSSAYPIVVVATASNTHFLQQWKRNATLFLPIGLIVSACLVYLVRRVSARAASMDSQLRRAMSRGEMSVVYQPVVELRTGRCIGCEALMRWEHSEQGDIPPAVFVPVAERTEVIFPLTEWLMKCVAADLENDFRKYSDLFVDINVCAIHFQDDWLLHASRRCLTGRLDIKQVVFELTERDEVARGSLPQIDAVDRLRESGARLSIDDFGVGYSNLRALQDIEFDFLKIDKAFVDGIATETRSSGLVDAVIGIASARHTEMVAEGIEHLYQAQYLLARGVAKGQGFLYAKPMSAAQYSEYLRKERQPGSSA